ncbi:hypothetical protein L7F22_045501 [Adiantum nelumboides]|nr:hypothetical protein [Adiantum nelumboides]
MEEAARSTVVPRRAKIGYLKSSKINKRMQIFTLWLGIMMVPISIVMGAGTPASAPTTATASPPVANDAAAPPPTTTKAATPPKVAATAPKASPPVVEVASPPEPTAIPPAAAPPPKKVASSPPKPSANVTSTPPVAPPKSAPPTATPPPKSTPKATPPSLPPTPAVAPAPVSPSDLEISQIAALRQLKVPFNAANPCKTSDDILLCDNSDPPRHLTSLSLKNCPRTANFTTAVLFNLSSLQSLELVNCSVKPVHVPSVLAGSLKTFICDESLGRTGTNMKADKLPGTWLSKLTALEELSVTDVEVSVSDLHIIVQNMKGLTQLIVSRTNMPGVLPRNTWPDNVEYIDLSGNSIRGTLPSQMRTLSQLKHLNLGDNQIKGVLPNIFGDLQQLQYIDLSGNQFSGRIPGSLAFLRNCSYLDLSNNKLNGSIPANLTLIRTLKHLDLSQNELSGPIPFNSTFLNKLTTLRLGENAGLCYNHTALKSKFLTGIRNCVTVADDTGLFAPAPAPASSDLSASSGKSGRISKGAAAGISVVVIVAAAAVVFVARKWWKSRQDVDEFVNLRAQKDRP